MNRPYKFIKKHSTACWLLGLLASVVTSCDNKDIDSFDMSTSYIYFDIPYIVNSDDGTETTYREDSISYSFALDPETVTDTTLKVVVKTIGMTADYDRPYGIEIVNENTTATSAEWDPSIINNRSIKAGELTDTIRIKVNRTDAMEEEWMKITLHVLPNENFAIGYGNLEEVLVSFSDILAKPDWWDTYSRYGYFGNFYPEVYRKWIEIYHEGADPMLHPYNHEPMYWDNMPPSPTFYSYPVMALYYKQLQQYFLDNDIIPEGENEPIRIPGNV